MSTLLFTIIIPKKCWVVLHSNTFVHTKFTGSQIKEEELTSEGRGWVLLWKRIDFNHRLEEMDSCLPFIFFCDPWSCRSNEFVTTKIELKAINPPKRTLQHKTFSILELLHISMFLNFRNRNMIILVDMDTCLFCAYVWH